MCFGILGPQHDRAIEARKCLPEPLQSLKRDAVIIQDKNIVGTSFERQLDMSQRLCVVALLQENGAKQLAAVKMVGLHRENLNVDLFRLGEAAGLMMAQALGKRRR